MFVWRSGRAFVGKRHSLSIVLSSDITVMPTHLTSLIKLVFCSTTLYLTTVSCISSDRTSAFPIGFPQLCSNEGEVIQPSFLQSDPCITCRCTGGLVVCNKEQCANAMCHVLLSGQKINSSSCCEKCKQCHLNGRWYSHGEKIVDQQDPCNVMVCNSGIITQHRTQCPVLCEQPQTPQPGHCCSRCSVKSCEITGMSAFSRLFAQPFRNGNIATAIGTRSETGTYLSTVSLRTVSSVVARFLVGGSNATRQVTTDPCEQCQCDSQSGHVTCHRMTCPVMACSVAESVLTPGRCCPHCPGVLRLADENSRCRVAGLDVANGTEFHLDSCTICRCEGSTAVCRRQSCAPPLQHCPQRRQLPANSSCCSVCRQPQRVRRNCRHKRRVIEDGATWSLSECTRCQCSNGSIECSRPSCPELICPYGQHLTKVAGECCRQCVEDDAVCTVFGDPHYNTFDGRLFSYQGTCRYMLAKDCVGQSFSVRVANDPKSSQFFSWTKTAFIKVGSVKVTLKQNYEVKVNGKEVTLPFVDLDEVTIYRNPKDNYNVVVRLYNIGVTLTWDGDSFLQVQIPPLYKGRMCGLCGNYNGNKSDDFTNKRHKLVKSVAKFARSWRIGGRKFCSRTPTFGDKRKKKKRLKVSELSREKKRLRTRALRKCGLLHSPIFEKCHSAVSPEPYYQSCLQDMSECGAQRTCYCEASTAYAHACGRHDLEPEDWVNRTHCGVDRQCAVGEKYTTCALCQSTCASPNVDTASCLSHRQKSGSSCTPGCVCRKGMLLHNKKCIPSIFCPGNFR